MSKAISTVFLFFVFSVLISSTLLTAQYFSYLGPDWLFIVKKDGEKILGPGLVFSTITLVLAELFCFIFLISQLNNSEKR